jgi:hypothetical protein
MSGNPTVACLLLLTLGACEGAAGSGRVDTVIEYRHISQSQTCRGNWRVRVTGAGEVYHARNREDCPQGQLWNTPFPEEPTHQLGAWQRWWLWRKLPVEALFALPEHITDPSRATMGGSREEVELTDGVRHHRVVVDNADQDDVTAVREALRRFVLLDVPTAAQAAPEGAPGEPAPPSALRATPPLPDDTALQLFCRSTGHLERFMDDGRWLVQEPGGELAPQTPRSYYEPDGERLSEDALRRIRERLDEVGFFELPGRVDGAMPGPDVLLTGGQGAPQALVYVFTASDDSSTAHSVEVEAEIRALDTFGVLHPLAESLDREAWGRWMNE